MLFPRPFRPSARLLRPGRDRLGAQLILTQKKPGGKGQQDHTMAHMPARNPWFYTSLVQGRPMAFDHCGPAGRGLSSLSPPRAPWRLIILGLTQCLRRPGGLVWILLGPHCRL